VLQAIHQVAEDVGTVKEDVGTVKEDVGTVKQKVEALEGVMKETSSRTVPASEISQQKLDDLFTVLKIDLSPVDGAGDIEARLLNSAIPPAATDDAIFTWWVCIAIITILCLLKFACLCRFVRACKMLNS
jgi:hypothetical protein